MTTLHEPAKKTKPRLSAGTHAVYLLTEVLTGSGLIESAFRKHNRVLEILSSVLLALLLYFHWKNWAKRDPYDDKEEGHGLFPKAATTNDKWRPPGAPPPIG